MISLPNAFLNRMKTQLGVSFPEYLRAMEKPAARAFRVNGIKIRTEELCSVLDFQFSPVPDVPGAWFFPDSVPIGRHPAHAAGLLYVQEPSAQIPISELPLLPGMRVLDLCAAPGGKSGQIAEKIAPNGLLVSNEPVRSRAEILSGNLERLGITQVLVTSQLPERLCPMFSAFFDAVVVDAPCSGEGMFRKDPDAVREWSEKSVLSCAERQRSILSAAVSSVRPGGFLLYSTCTFSPEEDEAVLNWLIDQYPAFQILKKQYCYPHQCSGEGQFYAILQLDSSSGCSSSGKFVPASVQIPSWEAFCQSSLSSVPDGIPVLLPDQRVMLLPETGLPVPISKLPLLRAGIWAGTVHQNRFEPSHMLALSLPRNAFQQSFDVSPAFLAGETVACDPGLSGWCACCYQKWPVGLGKAVHGTMKNHIPKGLRIR